MELLPYLFKAICEVLCSTYGLPDMTLDPTSVYEL
jgi:hypothetical protein